MASDTVRFRLWPPVAIGAPLLAGGIATTWWGDPVAVALMRWGAILPEERFLHERFGEPYDAYRRHVHRWL